MPMRFICIADEDTVRGFSLAGVEGRTVDGARQASEALARAAARADIGIIIMTEDVAAGIRKQVDAFRSGRASPLIVEIPGPLGPMHGRRSLREIAQEAIGIHVDQEPLR